jgi:hypothetical protein
MNCWTPLMLLHINSFSCSISKAELWVKSGAVNFHTAGCCSTESCSYNENQKQKWEKVCSNHIPNGSLSLNTCGKMIQEKL